MPRLFAALLCLFVATPPLAVAQDTVVTLLQVNDLHGRVVVDGEPQGLAKLATLIEQVREEMPHVVVLDAGDTISGQPEFFVTDGRGIIAAMNALGFDALTVGNHEFDRGHELAAATLAEADFPVLTNNIVHGETGELWSAAEPYTVIERGGVKIGVFGLTTPNTMVYQYPRGMGGMEVPDPIPFARETVRQLREEEGVDVVVALSHWGYPGDQKLAAEVDGIDVILGGHSHTTLEDQVWINDTLITQTGAHGKALGRVDLLFRPEEGGDGFELVSISGRDGEWWGHGGVEAPTIDGRQVTYPNRPLSRPTADTPDHPGVMEAYRPYQAKTEAYLAETIGRIESPIPGEGARERETPLGNLFADAIRDQTDADVAVMASSQFREKTLEPGEATRGDIFDLSGSYTRQHIVTVQAPGRHVRAMLESIGEKPGEQPLHVSGATVRPEGVTLEGGEPLEEDETYRVAGAAHVMQDHLIGKEGVSIVYDDPAGPTTRDVLMAYIREQGTVDAPATDRTQASAEAAAAGVGR